MTVGLLSDEFETKEKEILNCHSCNSLKIEKSLMKPNLVNKKKKFRIPKFNDKNLDIKNS